MSTITAAGHTWVHVERGTGPGCWHQDTEGGRCLSLQGVVDEHTSWVWLQAREQIAQDLLAVQMVDWALAGQHAGFDAAKIARGES